MELCICPISYSNHTYIWYLIYYFQSKYIVSGPIFPTTSLGSGGVPNQREQFGHVDIPEKPIMRIFRDCIVPGLCFVAHETARAHIMRKTSFPKVLHFRHCTSTRAHKIPHQYLGSQCQEGKGDDSHINLTTRRIIIFSTTPSINLVLRTHLVFVVSFLLLTPWHRLPVTTTTIPWPHRP